MPGALRCKGFSRRCYKLTSLDAKLRWLVIRHELQPLLAILQCCG
jgi:hypothetical protein